MARVLSRCGFILIEIMIVAAVVATITSIAIPNLRNSRRTANAAVAKENIRSLSTSSEVAQTARGAYPATVPELCAFIPSASQYCADASGTPTQIQGYNYSCYLSPGGYTFVASPALTGAGGTIVYTGTTGGVLTPL